MRAEVVKLVDAFYPLILWQNRVNLFQINGRQLFLRGFFDGDGCFRVFVHPESQYPQIRVSFASASPEFIRWLRREIEKELRINGFIEKAQRNENQIYAISDSLKLLNYMYYSPNIVYLSRKFQKAKPYFRWT